MMTKAGWWVLQARGMVENSVSFPNRKELRRINARLVVPITLIL